MPVRKAMIAIIIFILLISPVYTISVSSEDSSLPSWSQEWSYRQEVTMPISTDDPFAKFQPIDIRVEFDHPCWARDEITHSIRVCCWDGYNWHELDSQIYDLSYTDNNRILVCSLVFLVPEISDGTERYFVYYDDDEKSAPGYVDHVDVEDAYFYYEPISGVAAEGDYYQIEEDGFYVYGVGQKGKVMNRQFSQVVVKERPEATEFDAFNSDQVASFSFSYHHGAEDKDEVSSDQVLISKEIIIDGTLMVKFGVISESEGKDLRTTNIYKYYYCPTKEKRICVHVKHEVLKECKVKGIENVDGRYGALVSFKGRSARIQAMRFGEILPFLHVYGENGNIREYHIDLNPQSKEREWIVSYQDDCDLGKDAWLSYDEGESGKAHAIIFSSNEHIVKSGTGERDGIQVKVAEREYLDIIGTEVDYVAINFGRNSFEKGGSHDLEIPENFVVEFDAEFFTTDENGYKGVIEEAEIFRNLIKHRHQKEADAFEGEGNIHTLTVIPRVTGRLLSYPRIFETTGGNSPVTWVELYKEDTLVDSGRVMRSFLCPQKIKFRNLYPGEYLVKVYRKIGNFTKRYIGVEPVAIDGDKTLGIYCTWQKTIRIIHHDQYGKGIEYIEFLLSKRNTVIKKNITTAVDEVALTVPFSFFDPYTLKGFYKGFLVYDQEIPAMKKKVDVNFDIYGLKVEITDNLGFHPGVDIKPLLTSPAMNTTVEITPDVNEFGKLVFKNLPSAPYQFHMSYGSYSGERTIEVPIVENSIAIKFPVTFDLAICLYDSYGIPLEERSQKIDIIRNGRIVAYSADSGKVVTLPPGDYTIKAYSEGNLIALKHIQITGDKTVKIATIIEPSLPTILTILVFIFIVEILVLLLIRKISLNTFLKMMAMSLILISLFQPWWVLTASSNADLTSKTSEMFIFPQTMIETTVYRGVPYLDIATIPELFTDFLGILLIIVCSGFALLGISFIPNIVLKKRFSFVLIFSSILFLVLVIVAFLFGMSLLCEISLGSLIGEGMLEVLLPNCETTYMSAQWGLGIGFYLGVISALVALTGGIMDYLTKECWPKTLLQKTKKF